MLFIVKHHVLDILSLACYIWPDTVLDIEPNSPSLLPLSTALWPILLSFPATATPPVQSHGVYPDQFPRRHSAASTPLQATVAWCLVVSLAQLCLTQGLPDAGAADSGCSTLKPGLPHARACWSTAPQPPTFAAPLVPTAAPLVCANGHLLTASRLLVWYSGMCPNAPLLCAVACCSSALPRVKVRILV